MLGHGRSIGCVMVHIVTVADLHGAAVAATVMGDDAEALGDEEQHLRVPVIRTEGPAVMKDKRLGTLRPPILEEYFRTVLGLDQRHLFSSSIMNGNYHTGLGDLAASRRNLAARKVMVTIRPPKDRAQRSG